MEFTLFFFGFVLFGNSGKLQRGGNGSHNNGPLKTDENGNELAKELTFKVLEGFEPKAYCVELVKPGDIELVKEDTFDVDNGREKIRESMLNQHIVIKRNVNDILHHGVYTSEESERLGLIDGRCSFSDIYTKIVPELLGLEEKKISYLYAHRYYQRVFQQKLEGGIPGIPNPTEEPKMFDIQKWIDFGGKSTKIAYIGATNGQIIDGKSTKDKIGSTTLWYVY